MQTKQYPQQSTTVHVENLNGELSIYDWQRMEVHNLNPTAARVWELCDGATTPQQMAAQLHGDLTPAQAEELVWLSLKRLEKANLLESNVVQPAGRKVYSRREMLAKMGVAALMLPVITSIMAPSPVAAQSVQCVVVGGTGDLQATATWSPSADIDIHVVEPTGQTVYYANPTGPTATLDVDSGGVGPENIFVPTGGAANGTYEVYVVYFGGSGPITVQIQITAFANRPQEICPIFTRQLITANTTTGINVANVTFPAGTITETSGTRPAP